MPTSRPPTPSSSYIPIQISEGRGALPTPYYKILWSADEDVFVELLPEDERGKTSFFSNPVYFR